MNKKQKQKLTKIPELPDDFQLIKLPKDFDYNHYLNMSKETDLSRWGFEFAKRQENMTKAKLLEDSGGIRYKTGIDDIKTIWMNGVYIGGNLNTHDCKNYLDDCIIQYLKEAKGVFIPDGEESQHQKIIKEYKIHSTIGTPESENYKKWRHKLGKTYFPTPEIYWTCHKKINRINNTTATFLINLEMPTNKILSEIKNRIEVLKDKKNIKEIDFTLHKGYEVYWAMGLACFDLRHKHGKTLTHAARYYLNYCFNTQQDKGNNLTENEMKSMLNNTYYSVKDMIDDGWKKLVGNPL